MLLGRPSSLSLLSGVQTLNQSPAALCQLHTTLCRAVYSGAGAASYLVDAGCHCLVHATCETANLGSWGGSVCLFALRSHAPALMWRRCGLQESAKHTC